MKTKLMPINNLGDLTHLVNVNMDLVEHWVKKLRKSNRRLKALAVVGVAYAAWSEYQRRTQEEEIYRLTLKVDKLEREGE